MFCIDVDSDDDDDDDYNDEKEDDGKVDIILFHFISMIWI